MDDKKLIGPDLRYLAFYQNHTGGAWDFEQARDAIKQALDMLSTEGVWRPGKKETPGDPHWSLLGALTRAELDQGIIDQAYLDADEWSFVFAAGHLAACIHEAQFKKDGIRRPEPFPWHLDEWEREEGRTQEDILTLLRDTLVIAERDLQEEMRRGV